MLKEVIVSVAILGVAITIVLVLNFVFSRVRFSLLSYAQKSLKSLSFKKYKILDQKQIQHLLLLVLNLMKYSLFALIFFLTLPAIFSVFPQTHSFAITLWGYFLYPIRKIFFGIVGYIPELITIVVILFFVSYLLKVLKFFSGEIEKGRLSIKGFYPEWAKPTYLLLKCLIYAFTVALIFPYLPGSDSRIFQGVSVFVGLVISIGSSSAIGNLVAGLVITYMRPFHINDRIKIGESVGFVVEKSAFVVRILTDKKEYITFPNITILTSNITNFSQSKDTGDGLIVGVKVSAAYSIDWREVHKLLISAAKKTKFVEQAPEPFVLQKSLDDFYCTYEINAYTKEVLALPQVYSELYKNVLEAFSTAGIDLTSPIYQIEREEK